MKIKAIKCHTCEDVVFSRTEGDFRECSCGLLSVSGGQTHFKHEAINEAPHEKKQIFLDCNQEELYNDWDSMTDFYGLIKAKPSNTHNIKHTVCF